MESFQLNAAAKKVCIIYCFLLQFQLQMSYGQIFIPDADGHASDGEDFCLIQPVTVLKPEECCLGDTEIECFRANAGKPDLKLSTFFSCSCTLDSGSPCFQQFISQELLDLRMHHLTLERDTADLVILSQLRSSLRCRDMTQDTKRRVNTERQKVRVNTLTRKRTFAVNL